MGKDAMRTILLVVCFGLCSCAGGTSTLKEGFAFKMSSSAASQAVYGAVVAGVSAEYVTSNSGLEASGYIRQLVDTHTFNVSAIPVPAQGAYGFSVSHHGTIFIGPMRAHQIYDDLVRRAAASGVRVSVPK